MTPNPEELKRRVRELSEKATKGPWRSKLNHAPYKCVHIDKGDNYTTLELKPEDADLIAEYRTAAPALCDLLDASERREAELRKALEDAREELETVKRREENVIRILENRIASLLKPQPPKP